MYKLFFSGWHVSMYATKANIIQLFTEISNMLSGFQSIAKLLCWVQFYADIKNWFSKLLCQPLRESMMFLQGRRSGLVVSALDSGASAPGSSPGRGHCVVFLGKTLKLSQCLSPPRCMGMGTGEFNAGGNPVMD